MFVPQTDVLGHAIPLVNVLRQGDCERSVVRFRAGILDQTSTTARIFTPSFAPIHRHRMAAQTPLDAEHLVFGPFFEENSGRGYRGCRAHSLHASHRTFRDQSSVGNAIDAQYFADAWSREPNGCGQCLHAIRKAQMTMRLRRFTRRRGLAVS